MDVAMPVVEDMPMYELGIACEVFGAHWTDPWYSLRLCASGPTRIESGFVISPSDGYESLTSASMVLIPALPHAWLRTGTMPVELVAAVREAAAAGARMVSLCSGAFVLAAAGVLDGMRATTHWQQAAKLAQWHPSVEVDPAVLYVDNGDVLTSAGRSAALDLCLHIVGRDFGAQVANDVARRMVVPTHRPGGQAQYIAHPVPSRDSDSMGVLLQWAGARLDSPLTVDRLAREARMSTRTLARRFQAATGTTPRQWLLSQRLNRARELLESTDLSVDQISERCGLGSSANFRSHFGAVVGTTPTAYRRAFRA